MTLIEFIKSKLSDDGKLGDLARDIQGDSKFPIGKPEVEILSYLNFQTQLRGANSTFIRLVKEFKKQIHTENNDLDLDTKYALLKTENWKFYKEYFPVDKVILIGDDTDFYKVYCIDSTSQKGLFFDIKSPDSLNDISFIDEQKIHIGGSTQHVSVSEAINSLENCVYAFPVTKPNKENFKELIEFLKLNN